MFGLENQKKKKKNEDFIFDLEKTLQSSNAHRGLIQKIEERVQKIKEVLRGGGSQEEFDQFGVLLHGYTALLKVISRIKAKT